MTNVKNLVFMQPMLQIENIQSAVVVYGSVLFMSVGVGYLCIFLYQYILKEKFNFKKSNSRKVGFSGFPLSLTVALFFFGIYLVEAKQNILISQSAWDEGGRTIFVIICLLSFFLFLHSFFRQLFKSLRSKFDISIADNLKARKVITQIQYLEKLIQIFLWIFGIGLIFMQFDKFAKFGTTILASAGVASVVLGLAAQESVSNLIAGFQIAFSQPLRIDDAVVVENEWGWIEEINLTYVVVRLWDKRRLVLPVKYFVSNPFQNWTRNDGQIIGSVFWEVDHRAPVEKIRSAYTKIVESCTLWDGEVSVLQVTESTTYTLQLRGLVSAKTSPEAWDLRCEVREKLLAYIAAELPEALPRRRWEDFHETDSSETTS